MLTLNLNPLSTEAVVKALSVEGADTDVYTWYEGPKGLPEKGSTFLQKELLDPLKGKVKFCLYSLCGWDFEKTVSKIPSSTSIGEKMGCIYASSFFRWCQSEGGAKTALYQYLRIVMPKKKWLFAISQKLVGKKLSMKVGDFFERVPSIFDRLYANKTSYAYSAIQYVEAYYLIRESVAKALAEKRKDANVFFVLPNDEGKYYQDLPKELDVLLKLDFGDRIKDLKIKVTFLPYLYTSSIKARPYLAPKELQ